MNGFARQEVQGLPFYSCRAFEELPDLRHGFSTRHGGVSSPPKGYLNLGYLPWDSTERVKENRRRFLSALTLQAAHLATLRQIHSDQVHIIKENPARWNQSGDALVTQQEGLALAVKVADCFPILIADPMTKTIAAVHSGWRGMLKRVFQKTVEKMRITFGCDPASLLIAIGPGIRACCFEVGSEVVDLFKTEYPKHHLAESTEGCRRRYLLDLRRALDIQIEETGVRPGKVHDLDLCTCCHSGEFFSYRAEGPSSGRMMGVIANIKGKSPKSSN